MLTLICDLLARAPERSLLVVESDENFDTALLPDAAAWDRREYPPAVVSLFYK